MILATASSSYSTPISLVTCGSGQAQREENFPQRRDDQFGQCLALVCLDERRVIAQSAGLILEADQQDGLADASQADDDQALGWTPTLDSGERHLRALQRVMPPGEFGRGCAGTRHPAPGT